MLRRMLDTLYNYELVLLTTHRNADPDALASLFFLKNFITLFTHRLSYIVLPEGLSEVSKRIAKELSLHNNLLDSLYIVNTSIIRSYNVLYIVVDTSSSEQLGLIRGYVSRSKYILVDHHRAGDLGENALLSIVDPYCTSTSELVYMLLSDLYRPCSLEATLLLTGILYDTRRFLITSSNTLRVASELIDAGGDYRRAIRLLQVEIGVSEKIARLKAMQRMNFIRVGDIIIAYSYVGAFESSVARALLDLGADIAIVGSSDKEVVRIVVRGKPEVLKRLGLSLGRDVMVKVGEYLGGGGGGHDAAAAASGCGDLFKALDYTVRLVKEFIESVVKSR